MINDYIKLNESNFDSCDWCGRNFIKNEPIARLDWGGTLHSCLNCAYRRWKSIQSNNILIKEDLEKFRKKYYKWLVIGEL